MLLLLTLPGHDAEVGKLISTMARVRGLSANRLAATCGVQKSALLRFCKGQQGGYLSAEARERVLAELGWERGALSREQVHVWQIGALDDAKFVFGHVLQNGATLSFLKPPSPGTAARVAVGVTDEVPFIVFATYDLARDAEDPMVSNSAGPYRPAAGMLADARALEIAKQSPKAFSKVFAGPRATVAEVATSVFETPAIKRLLDLGFAEHEINDLAEDFVSMQCRTAPASMRKRLLAQWQANEIFRSSPIELRLKPAFKSAVDIYIAEMAVRPLKCRWES